MSKGDRDDRVARRGLGPTGRRVRQLVAAGLVAAVVSLAWMTAVSLVPATSRPSPAGTIACVATWHTDFRADLPKIDIPVLVLHGTEDRILPIEACGARTHELIAGSEYVQIQGASHG
jgi:pimeloyl-ACP methyl ester carboxylesterase